MRRAHEAHGVVNGSASTRLRGAVAPLSMGSVLLGSILVTHFAPPGIGAHAYRVVSAFFFLVMVLAPLARRVRPRRVWVFQSLSSFFCFLGAFQGVWPVEFGPIRFFDLCFAVGYTLCGVWVVQLHRYVFGPLRNRTPLLDTITVPLGLGLGMWTVALAPLGSGNGLPAGLVELMYPTADAVLLTLLVHLARRMPVVPTSLGWLVAAFTVQLVIDIVYTVNVVVLHHHSQPWSELAFLFTYAAMAIVTIHPSVADIARPVRNPVDRPVQRGPGFILLMMSTAVLAVAVPSRGTYDTVVRTVLVIALLTMLFVRLTTTMRDLHRAQVDSARRAMHDPLTGLLNRTALFASLAEKLRGADQADPRGAEVADCDGDGESVALLYLDCDDFKYVNDTWGHHAGDRLLCDIASRVAEQLDPADVLARHGGDEFVIVTAVREAEEAAVLAERIRRTFDEPIRILPTRLHAVTPSIGIAIAVPGDGTSPQELLRRADVAMYEAKSRGRGHFVIFDESSARRSHTRAAVGDRLGDAVRLKAFDVHLQPIMGGDGYDTLVGWEALARWRDPVLGDIPPDVFIEVAEQHGYIADLGAFVLRRACRELSELHAALGRADLSVSVNVSAVQLAEADFADIVLDARREAGLTPNVLRLEVTETLLLQDGPVVSANLQRLAAGGVRIGIDDFGTGYASLASLLSLPIDCVKLDRSLVARLDGGDTCDASGVRTLTAVVDFLSHLGIDDVVAEGVETERQAAALRRMGCSMAQGWLYGRPAPAADIIAAANGVSTS